MPNDHRGGVSKAALLDHLVLLDQGGHLRPKSGDPAPQPSSPATHGHDHDCHCGGACDECKVRAEKRRRALAALRERVQQLKTKRGGPR